MWDKIASAPIFPRRSIFAGCTHATRLLLGVLFKPLSRMVADNPRATVDIYIDDAGVMVTGPRGTVCGTFTKAITDLQAAFASVDCSLADEKGQLLATDDALAVQIADALGPVAGSTSESSLTVSGRRCSCGKGRPRCGKGRPRWPGWAGRRG
jgi:hypothetical protein